MIRGQLYKDISETLDEHTRFDSTDFRILAEKKDERNNFHTILSINYIIDSKYSIYFKIPSSKTSDSDGYSSYYLISGKVCPGPLSYEETFSFKGESFIYTTIKNWLDAIWQEVSSSPVVRQVEDHQEQINNIFEKFETLKEEYFTNQEAEELKKRLDALEETLKSQIESHNELKKNIEQEVSKLHFDIDTLKQTITSFSKKGWLKSFTGKIFKWTANSDNRKMVKGGYSLLREFLPDDIKKTLPE
ncbi:hypothetical protein PQ469_18015 [Mucilaginibacter sp. KACC 22773]|uniref:hypothetical protein n=1 Tax=Mucilaginibacter sp. KACC 22773 TaxID=3025671 RepID=UPI002365EB69|nr:hypothetical protein [Mucilaginibacter sp. KACC 22773]WDF75785.1 hypothetical protein PQ469_18015 [Mucilaginibacter sp. KACC 22773]